MPLSGTLYYGATTPTFENGSAMLDLTPEGRQIANDLSIRHNFSLDAVAHMMQAVQLGNGSMAQFNHHEFAGGGQWMSGGMTMIGDMFNNGLKGRVDLLCQEIANILATDPSSFVTGSFQSQSQSGTQPIGQQSSGSFQSQSSGGTATGVQGSAFFHPSPDMNWWPSELGAPASVGSQNNVGYAYFPQACRLAVRTGDDVWVYDTLNHQIGGFSQQQGMGGSIVFTSQFGTVQLSSLPVVFRNGQWQTPNAPALNAGTSPTTPMPTTASLSYPTGESSNNAATPPHPGTPGSANEDELPRSPQEILDAIERLAELNERGVITNDEFAVKKEDLLSRL